MKIQLNKDTAAYLFTALLRRREVQAALDAGQREVQAIDAGTQQVYGLLGATGEGWRLAEGLDGQAFLERDEG